nr:hypothetical protein [Tanacetum cinerariifolium]
MRDSPTYKTYLSFATGAATPKKVRKFKKPASFSKKKALVAVEEPAEKPIKKNMLLEDSLLVFKSEILLATVTAALATQKTKVPLQSSSILSDYATKFLNFDNIPSGETKIISMMDIKVQHENPSIQTSPFLTTLKNVDHSLALRVTIKSEVPTAVQEFLGKSLDDALYKAELQEFDQKRTLFETMTKTKSFSKSTKYKALYHALMESILKDEDAMDKGVVDKSKKRKPDDADKDEGPPAGPDQWFKRNTTGEEPEPSKRPSQLELPKAPPNLSQNLLASLHKQRR